MITNNSHLEETMHRLTLLLVALRNESYIFLEKRKIQITYAPFRDIQNDKGFLTLSQSGFTKKLLLLTNFIPTPKEFIERALQPLQKAEINALNGSKGRGD